MDTPLRIGRHVLEASTRRVLLDGTVVPLGARAFDLLVALVERRERVVGKDELLDLVWPGLVVEENNLQVQVGALRRVLGAAAITTVSGRGYRFTAEVQPVRDGARGEAMAVPGTPPPSLLGRAAELEALEAWLRADGALVTLVGAGGIGKTRLARTLAASAAPAGAWVDLAVLSEGSQLPAAVARALGASLGEGDAVAFLASALRARGLSLLVLDNAEHLVADVAALCGSLRALVPSLRLLVTSQVALHADGEQVWRLDALALPSPGDTLDRARGAAAFALFETRARAGDQRFSIDDATLGPAIALVCALEGNALAIEMAAARVPQFGVAALAQRLADRLKLLRGPRAGGPARQQSLRAMLDWSVSLLAPAERAALRRLGVLAGDATLETAQALIADDGLDEWQALDALGTLVERSLLRREDAPVPRYRLPETTRLHALEQLDAAGERAAAEQRHGVALARRASAAWGGRFDAVQQAWLDALSAELPDVGLAFDRARRTGDAEVAAPCVALLSAVDQAGGVSVRLRTLMAEAHALLPRAATPLAQALLWDVAAPQSSIALAGIARLEAARQRAEAWRRVGDARQVYLATAALAVEQAIAGDVVAARGSVDVVRSIEDATWPPALRLAGARLAFDLSVHDPSFLADARPGLRRALALATDAGDERRRASMLLLIADSATGAGDLDEAIAVGQDAAAAMRAQHRPTSAGIALANLCSAWLQAGDEASARQAAGQALGLLRPHPYAGVLFNHLAVLAWRAGHREAAARLLGQADRFYLANQSPHRQATEARLLERALPGLTKSLGASRLATLREEGARLDEGSADTLARACALQATG